MERIERTTRQQPQQASARFIRITLSSLMLLSFFALPASAQALPFAIRWINTTSSPQVEITGIPAAALRRLQRWQPAQWQRLLAVYAGADESLPPMLGAYQIVSGALRFTPQFPLEPRVSYRAIFRAAALPGQSFVKVAPLMADFQPVRIATIPVIVSHISPGAEVLPENLLKFYLHFSAPMSRGRSYDHIQLLDSAGRPIELPFLELDEELWNPEMTRFTLLIDPGRIKRGVLPLEQIGPSLEEGKEYTLVIRRTWSDGRGNPLAADYRKTFRVGPPDRTPIDPQRWRIETPAPDSQAPLIIHFGEALDHALASRVIIPATFAGARINGIVSLTANESRWEFRPDRPWTAGEYLLLIEAVLEDLAGNNIGKPFEVDLFEGVQRRVETQIIRLPIAIR